MVEGEVCLAPISHFRPYDISSKSAQTRKELRHMYGTSACARKAAMVQAAKGQNWGSRLAGRRERRSQRLDSTKKLTKAQTFSQE